MKISITNLNKSKIKKTFLIMSFWILLWYAISIAVSNDILFVPPHSVLIKLISLLGDKEFYISVLLSASRINIGIIVGLIIGLCLGILSYKYSIVKDFLSPFFSVIKSIPVASFVVILLIWFGSSSLTFFISFLIVLPNVYVSVLSGLKSTDEKLLKMAKLFEFTNFQKSIYIYKDAFMPYLISNLKVTVGLGFKSGIAAEVIGMTKDSIGANIYMSKIYLDTAALAAWTIWAIALGTLFEKLYVKILEQILKYHPRVKNNKNNAHLEQKQEKCSNGSEYIEIDDINIAYGDNVLLSNYDLKLKRGDIHAIMGCSGIGKTSLLNEIYSRNCEKVSMSYQDDRLLEMCDGITNIMLGHDTLSFEEAKRAFLLVLNEEDINKSVAQYSGGMKRRIAVLRALLFESSLVLLDEPFTGLDDENKKILIEMIHKLKNGRTIVVVTHDVNDVGALGAHVIKL